MLGTLINRSQPCRLTQSGRSKFTNSKQWILLFNKRLAGSARCLTFLFKTTLSQLWVCRHCWLQNMYLLLAYASLYAFTWFSCIGLSPVPCPSLPLPRLIHSNLSSSASHVAHVTDDMEMLSSSLHTSHVASSVDWLTLPRYRHSAIHTSAPCQGPVGQQRMFRGCLVNRRLCCTHSKVSQCL